MARKNNGLLYGLGFGSLAVLTYKLYKLYNNFQEFAHKIDVSIYDVSINSEKTKAANYSRLFFRARFWLINPTEFTGTAQGITAALVVNGRTTAILKRSLNTTIIKKGKTPITADFELDTEALGINVASLISGDFRNLDLKIKGSVLVNKIAINFDLPVKIK